MEQIRSTEELRDYMHVTSPRMWQMNNKHESDVAGRSSSFANTCGMSCNIPSTR